MVGKTAKPIIYIVISFILSILLFACDVFTLKINEKRCLYLSEGGAKIKLTVKNVKGSHYFIKIESKEGNIEVNPQGLWLINIPPIEEKSGVDFIYKKMIMKEIFHVNQGETFECQFTVYPDFQNGISINEIHILPGDVITHNGESLITDTIKIRVQGTEATYLPLAPIMEANRHCSSAGDIQVMNICHCSVSST